MRKIKFWSRIKHDHYDEWRLVAGVDESGVPEICWRTFNKKFWQKHERNELYPADELAAYQEGCRAMMLAASRVSQPQPQPQPQPPTSTSIRVKPTTYIIAAGMTRLMQFVREEVTPEREQFRQVFDQCRVDGTFDVRAWVEAMPAVHCISPDEAQRMAREVIRATLPRCADDTQQALATLVACRMCASDAAEQLAMPLTTFRRLRDTRWYPDFRENSEEVVVNSGSCRKEESLHSTTTTKNYN